MIDTAATDGMTDGADRRGNATDNTRNKAVLDLAPVIVNDSLFEDPDYTPLDIYHGPADAGAPPPVPVIVSCPHAGRSYPASMLAAAAEPVEALRGLEDFGIDCLLDDLAQAGIPTLINRLSRAYIDVNRDPDAIDASMFSGKVSTRPPCHHVRAGYGLIPRLTAARKPIYSGKLPPAEITSRVNRVHAPYHRCLTTMMDGSVARFGKALLVDMHSMPAFDRLNNRLSDIICGDGYGITLDRDMASAITKFFKGRGLSVSWNHPYAGGFITRHYGVADSPRQSVQIEINRGLYMDGQTRLDSARMAELRAIIGDFGSFLATQDIAAA